ncbi:MAG: TonB-dependent receptor domain-containing protein [Vicinamibacterales bacterium]
MSTRSLVRRPPLRLLAVLAVMMAASADPVLAQQQLAAIQGTIADQTGGVLPGVTVTVTNLDTGVSRSTVTNEAGLYRVPSLEPGRYQVTAELQGFRKFSTSEVVLTVGATQGLSITLEPGAVTETVEVTGATTLVQTEIAQVSAVVEREKVEALPLVGRNVMALATLQPGINGVPGTTDFLSAEQGIGINASGQRGSGNSATIDGMSINGGPWGGTVLLVPNAEAVQEFQVIANNQSAEYGRNSGAAVSIITRGGTNAFRGSVFEFHRDKTLRAKGIFETVKPDFVRNDFGGSIGGPIRRDSTFFFASYEGVRETSGQGALYTVETEEFVNFVKATRPNSIAAKLLSTYKPPSYPTTGLRDLGSPAPGANVIGPPDGIMDVGTISHAFRNRRTGNQLNGRVDQVFRDGNDRLRATYYFSEIESPYSYLRSAFDHPYPFRNQLFSAGYTRVLSNQTLNEASFGWVRMHGEAGDPTPEAPTISITNLSAGFGVEFWHPIYFTQNNFEFKDTLTMTRGTHSLRMGAEFRLAYDASEMHHWERPNYNFRSILDFADDETWTETRAVNPATGLPTLAVADYRNTEFAFFAQDNWKLRPDMTLNLGLRYETFMAPTKSNGPFNGIILGPGSTRQEQVKNAKVAAVDSLYKTDWNNLAPRVGIAWDPAGDAKLVFRAGGGIAYNRINNTVWSDEKFNPPLFAQATGGVQDGTPMVYSLGPDYPPNPALGRGVDERGGIKGSRVALRVIDPEVVVPYVYSWFAGVQRQLFGNWMVEANYIGSAGRKLMSNDGPGGEDYNRFAGDLADGRRDYLNPSFSTVGLAESRISSEYHGLAVQVNRRFNRGFSLQASYTLGKATDTPGVATEVTRPELDKGPAGHDIRHKLAVNLLWQIPVTFASRGLDAVLGGWQVNTITFLQSGSHFSITCSNPYPVCDPNGDGYTGDRVNLPSFGTDYGHPSRSQWLAGVFKVSDFPLPAPGTLPNMPRNAYTGPGYFNTDLSLLKNFKLGLSSASNLQIRFEAFNVFNQVNLNNPATSLQSTQFGKVTSHRPMRVIQLGARFSF